MFTWETNAGENLTALKTFSSKEICKGNAIDDVVSSNAIFIGCNNTIVLRNTILAAPIILDLVLLAEGERALPFNNCVIPLLKLENILRAWPLGITSEEWCRN